jgi:hypothetical protein
VLRMEHTLPRQELLRFFSSSQLWINFVKFSPE